ncbi:similar to Saccharomyces cerevisiae YGR002C SWC4 Component of the Swr1p complex that incorporates Htz1p into chromatin [Maudiozyma saulgeensis]|uniref:SWR1-complex protein 4 n=1 Tax=Maudiozyma saulgeensis TaxID=1789683 RepID=A0A1X7RAA9_9SACH|nr:similar to Saccharomyces cerevisiae YGR002C SWC4 Component of the Swr1p complex that incorporates Htz1p into chromatin [Kazachstania saulgeensis]
MSSSDIFDVLNIKQKSKSPTNDSSPGTGSGSVGGITTGASSTLLNRAPKPQVTGMQRELYNLLGENQPSIVIQPTSKFKESLKSVTKSSPWTQARFKANKRLVLRHWVKGSKDLLGEEPQDSSFAKYDQHMSLPEFTKEEYELFMAEPDRDKKKDEKKDTGKDEQKDTGKDEKKAAVEDEQQKTEKSEGKESPITKETKSDDKPNAEDPKPDEDNETEGNKSDNTKPDGGIDEQDKKEDEASTSDEKNNEVDSNDKKDTDNSSTIGKTVGETNIMDDKDDKETPQEQKPAEWTYEEVEYLFGLCRTYDLRWFVISDRYSFKGIQRTIEELKTEFYMVSRKYFQSKNAADPLLASLEYPLDKELERKKYLERLLSRSAAEIAEEEALIIESRKFEIGAKKMLIERESMLRLLDSPNSDKSVAQHLSSQGISQLYSSLLADKTRKRKHDSTVPENPWMKQQQQFVQQKQQLQQLHERKPDISTGTKPNATVSSSLAVALPPNNKTTTTSATAPSVTASGTNNNSNNGVTPSVSGQADAPPPQKKTKKQKLEQQTAQKRKTDVAYAENLLKDFDEEEKKSLGISMHGEKLTPGVFLRSTRISTFKPALQNKVYGVLQELKLPIRPAMPSKAVVDKQEELLKQIVVLTDLKKTIDKLDAEKAVSQ